MLHGYALAEITYQTLKKACESKDLTRGGVVKALHTLSDVDTGGITAGPQNYTQVGEGPSRFTYVSKVDRKAPGGLTALGEPFESDLAKKYEYPKE